MFKELFEDLKKLNLPEDQYVLVGSSSLAIRGIREARDIDIITTDLLWKELSKTYPVNNEYGMDHISLGNESIEVLGNGSIFKDPSIATIEEMIQTADIFDGVRFLNLKLLKRFKQKLGREKDLKDIELIGAYLVTY